VLEADDASLGLLVEALVSGRAGIAESARAALMEHVDRLQLSQSRDNERKIALIVHELAQRAPALANNPVSQQSATDLASRVLVWTVCHGSTKDDGVIADCETILRVGGKPATSPTAAPASVRSRVFIADRSEGASRESRLTYQPSAFAEDQFALPGGRLTIEACRLRRTMH
jgi:hypothetical protein